MKISYRLPETLSEDKLQGTRDEDKLQKMLDEDEMPDEEELQEMPDGDRLQKTLDNDKLPETLDEDKLQEMLDENTETEFPFDDEIFGPQGKSRKRKSRSEKWEHTLQWNRTKHISSNTQLRAEGSRDSTMVENPSRVSQIKGLICRIWTPRTTTDITYEQIDLPKRYHRQVRS